MKTNNNKHIITNETVWLRQLLFAHATFLSLSKISVVFNISSSHSNTNLPIRRFQQEKSSVSNYSSILHTVLHSQFHALGFHMSFLQELPII